MELRYDRDNHKAPPTIITKHNFDRHTITKEQYLLHLKHCIYKNYNYPALSRYRGYDFSLLQRIVEQRFPQ